MGEVGTPHGARRRGGELSGKLGGGARPYEHRRRRGRAWRSRSDHLGTGRRRVEAVTGGGESLSSRCNR
jgi:hypothetical protein